MDIKKYIESGILEQYVLGTLQSSEVNEIHILLGEHPVLRAEVMSIEIALEQYAQAHSVAPPPGLEQLILQKIEAESPTPQPSSNPNNYQQNVGNTAQSSGMMGKILLLLISIGLIGALFGYFNANEKLKNLESDHAELQNEHEILKTDCEEAKANFNETEQYFAFIQDVNTKPIIMNGTDNAKNALSAVYWNPIKKKSYLKTYAMPEVPSDKQYQLWAIVDGKPVDMGVFDVALDANDLIEIPYIKDAQAFAVTLEKRGGVESPTMEAMYVIGENS